MMSRNWSSYKNEQLIMENWRTHLKNEPRSGEKVEELFGKRGWEKEAAKQAADPNERDPDLRGYYKEENLMRVTHWMQRTLAKLGLEQKIDMIKIIDEFRDMITSQNFELNEQDIHRGQILTGEKTPLFFQLKPEYKNIHAFIEAIKQTPKGLAMFMDKLGLAGFKQLDKVPGLGGAVARAPRSDVEAGTKGTRGAKVQPKGKERQDDAPADEEDAEIPEGAIIIDFAKARESAKKRVSARNPEEWGDQKFQIVYALIKNHNKDTNYVFTDAKKPETAAQVAEDVDMEKVTGTIGQLKDPHKISNLFLKDAIEAIVEVGPIKDTEAFFKNWAMAGAEAEKEASVDALANTNTLEQYGEVYKQLAAATGKPDQWDAVMGDLDAGKDPMEVANLISRFGVQGDTHRLKFVELAKAEMESASEPEAAEEPESPTQDKKTQSDIKYSLPKNWQRNLDTRTKEVYSALEKVHTRKHKGKDFKKDLSALIQLLGPHNSSLEVRKISESNRIGRLMKMIAKSNSGGKEDTMKSLGALKKADKSGAIYRIINTMLAYKGREGGHATGDDLSQLVGKLMTMVNAVDVSGRKSKKGGDVVDFPAQADDIEPQARAAAQESLLRESTVKRWQSLAGIKKARVI